MARHKEYDRHDILEKTAGLFWQKGYKATSMADIVLATGLNTASMYKEFGDKDGLFEEALDHYRQHIVPPRFQSLIDEPNINGIKKFIQAVVDSSSSDGYRGCLLMNHLAQKHTISPKAGEKVDEFCLLLESLLETAFRNAQADNDISIEKNPASLASFVICCIHGLVLYGRRSEKKERISNLHTVILGAF